MVRFMPMKTEPPSSDSLRPRRRRSNYTARGVTILDVARLAGVSTATVSRVLGGTERVSPERSQRVYEAVQQLNYQPDRVARRLRAPGRQLWALVVSDIENPFFTSLARGVEDAAHESGAVVILCNSDLDPEREKRYFEIAVTERVGGVVLAPSSPRVDISVLQQAKVPVVVVNQPLAHATVETITSDNTTGGELAAEEFLAHGYRRIAAIVGQTTAQGWSNRLIGLRERLAARGGEVVEVKYMNNRIDGGVEAMEQLLAQRDDFDAVFVSNNQMTVGALRALHAAGLSVPQDVGMIGCDLGSTPMTYPVEITSVNQDPRRMGFLAGAWVMESHDESEERQTTYLTPLLSRGDSLVHHAPPS